MDYNRDNPLRRFTSFWWAIAAFLSFGVLLLIILIAKRERAPSIEDVSATPRYEIKQKVIAEQEAALPAAQIEEAIPRVAAQLASTTPRAIEKPEQVVPGSATANKLAEAPPVDTSAVDAAVDPNQPIDPAVLEIGKAQYMLCAACHGQNGEGTPIAPPLAGSEWVNGPVSNLIRIQLRGLTGPITVKDTEYNFPGGMAAMAYQTDEQIAAVLTYVRNNFGNQASAVTPDQVNALRSEVGKPQVTVEELIAP